MTVIDDSFEMCAGLIDIGLGSCEPSQARSRVYHNGGQRLIETR